MAAVITENQATRISDKELSEVLSQLESLSDEDAKKVLAGDSDLIGIGYKHG